MKIQFFGAAQTVTGSCFVIEACGTRFAVDCGMHQGNREIESRNRETVAYRAGDIAFIVLTHAHIDHSGLLPRIVAEGYSGPIYCTPPTGDLIGIMLEDSARIQESEAEREVKRSARTSGRRVDADPLYTVEDARKASSMQCPQEYGRTFSPHPGIDITFYDAGHILGSAMVLLSITEDGRTSNILFSGDLGRPGAFLMYDPTVPDRHLDAIFMESTYGDRNHKNESDTLDELANAIAYSYGRRDKVLIPSFAVGRTQEILYCMYLLAQQGRLPDDMPIYVDSPLAVKATALFKKYSALLETKEMMEFAAEAPLKLPNIRFTASVAESQELNFRPGPAIIIAGSGMCNAGRIRHHLRHNAWRRSVSLVFVGYQGLGTPGRRIIDGAKTIGMFGERVAITAKIYTIGGFSAHAGQTQMLDWLDKVRSEDTQVILVHGEEKAQRVFAEKIKERFGIPVRIPGYMEEMELHLGTAPTESILTTAPAKQPPVVDWDGLLASTEKQVVMLRHAMADIRTRPEEDQIELRDRIADLNRDMLALLREI